MVPLGKLNAHQSRLWKNITTYRLWKNITTYHNYIQSILVISKSKGLSEILRDIRTSTYQICKFEEKINRITIFHKRICKLTPEDRDMFKILWKRGEIAP